MAATSCSVDEHLARILRAVEPLAPRVVPLEVAHRRVLAEEAAALVDVPGFDNSAMDGYAVRLADVETAGPDEPVTLQVVADLPAGSGLDPRLRSGEAARIMTGAPVPADADCIVPVEDTDGGDRTVTVLRAPRPAAHIRRRGTDVRAGEPVLPAGIVLGPTQLAAAAATGMRELRVHPAPRVGVVATGDELVSAGEPLGRGKIHDSNTFLLEAAVAEAGGVPVRIGPMSDDEAAFRQVFERYAGEVDAFVTSGGVSVGAYDVVKAVLAPVGVWFGSVRMQPGKPQGFGTWADGPPIFALPGNPVSVFVSFEAFVRPALLKLQGRTDLHRPVIDGVVVGGWRSSTGRAQYMPVAIEASSGQEGGGYRIRPASAGGSGSYLAAGLARADGLAIVPEDVVDVRDGAILPVLVTR